MSTLTPDNLSIFLTSARATLDQIEKLYGIAEAVQWEKSPAAPAARDDTTERSKGAAVSNPTLDVVADDRRLAVRAEVRRASDFAQWLDGATRTIADGLDASVGAWEGLVP